MSAAGALHQALILAGSPMLAGPMREQPLPDDVLSLIQIAAGDPAATLCAVKSTGLAPDRLREAAVLYVQHVVFAPNADHYRILTVHRDAPRAALREHLGWLMKWLHPDRARGDGETVFAQRVLAAWNQLKMADTRAEYDRSLPPLPPRLTPSGRRRAAVRVVRAAPRIAAPLRARRSARFARAAALVLVGAAAATVVLAWWPQSVPSGAVPEAPVAALGGGS